jgi:hypothetical protein
MFFRAPRSIPKTSPLPIQYLAYKTDDYPNTAAIATALAGAPLATDATRLTATAYGAIERTGGAMAGSPVAPHGRTHRHCGTDNVRT